MIWGDLFIGEAHAEPYLWAAVALSHGFIGSGVAWVLAAALRRRWAVVLASLGYALWETQQGLLMDGILDWCAFTLGALMIRWPVGGWLAVMILAIAGAAVRNG